MSVLPGRLGTLRIRDIMTADPFVLRETMTLLEAVRQLQAHNHSGAPVVEETGKLVGTLSLRDILKTKREHDSDEGSGNSSALMTAPSLPRDQRAEPVREHMRKSPGHTTQDKFLLDAARIMADQHMHRLPIVDEEGTLVGLVSTMDILAALVNVADEASEA